MQSEALYVRGKRNIPYMVDTNFRSIASSTISIFYKGCDASCSSHNGIALALAQLRSLAVARILVT